MDRNAYLQLLESASPRSVALGGGGVNLFTADELDSAQIGYAVDPDGRPLTGGDEGDWRTTWLVIGSETSVGDPVFIDLSQTEMPVCTAMHGMGEWEPQRIADSAVGFFHALDLVSGIARGRETPVALKRNPVSAHDRDAVLREIRTRNPGSEADFWALLLRDSA
jgi:hypothetical protein